MAGVAPGGITPRPTCDARPGGHDGFIEGAMTTMLVFKRLTALAVTIGVILAGAGMRAWRATGSRRHWQLGFQQSATPVMDNIVSFHTFLLCDHHRDHGCSCWRCC